MTALDRPHRRNCESAIALDGLAQSLHDKFDGSRREVAPDLELGLELLLWVSLEIFPYCPPGGRALPSELFADKRVDWHERPSTPETKTAHASGGRGPARWGGMVRGPGWSPEGAKCLRLHQCASAVSHQLGNREAFAHLHDITIAAARVSKETAPAKGEAEAVFDALEQLFCCSPFSRSGAPCA